MIDPKELRMTGPLTKPGINLRVYIVDEVGHDPDMLHLPAITEEVARELVEKKGSDFKINFNLRHIYECTKQILSHNGYALREGLRPDFRVAGYYDHMQLEDMQKQWDEAIPEERIIITVI